MYLTWMDHEWKWMWECGGSFSEGLIFEIRRQSYELMLEQLVHVPNPVAHFCDLLFLKFQIGVLSWNMSSSSEIPCLTFPRMWFKFLLHHSKIASEHALNYMSWHFLECVGSLFCYFIPLQYILSTRDSFIHHCWLMLEVKLIVGASYN